MRLSLEPSAGLARAQRTPTTDHRQSRGENHRGPRRACEVQRGHTLTLPDAPQPAAGTGRGPLQTNAASSTATRRRRRPPHTPHPGPRCLDGQETLSTPTCPGSRRPPTTAVPSVSRLVRAGVGPHPGTGRQRLLPERSWGHSPLAAPHPPLQGSDLNRHRSQRRGPEPRGDFKQQDRPGTHRPATSRLTVHPPPAGPGQASPAALLGEVTGADGGDPRRMLGGRPRALHPH